MTLIISMPIIDNNLNSFLWKESISFPIPKDQLVMIMRLMRTPMGSKVVMIPNPSILPMTSKAASFRMFHPTVEAREKGEDILRMNMTEDQLIVITVAIVVTAAAMIAKMKENAKEKEKRKDRELMKKFKKGKVII